MDKENMTHKLVDGRVLGFAEFGDAHGKPVFYLHGGGAGSRFFAQTLESVALQNNIRLISPDRPGIGLADFQPNRTILDWAKDIIINLGVNSKSKVFEKKRGIRHYFDENQIPLANCGNPEAEGHAPFFGALSPFLFLTIN